MNFVYILSGNLEVIEFAKINSERYSLLREQLIFKDNIASILLPISFDNSSIENLINQLLFERETKPLDIPDYRKRFKEEDIFVQKEFRGNKFKLCNTGFDNKLIFFINIYNSNIHIEKNKRPNYLIFVENIRDFKEWLKKHK